MTPMPAFASLHLRVMPSTVDPVQSVPTVVLFTVHKRQRGSPRLAREVVSRP